MTKTLKEDDFMRISYIVRDSGKKVFIYIRKDQKLKDLGAEKVTGHEEISIIHDIKTEEENAASGMGMIFG